MLENLVEKLGKYVGGFIILLLAFVFALQFGGPQAQGCTHANTATSVAAEVYGTKITAGEFRANQRLLNFDGQPDEVRKAQKLDELVLNGLVDRALLVEQGKKLGFSATPEDALRHLIDKDTLYITVDADAPPTIPNGEIPAHIKKEDGSFDQEQLKKWVQYGLRRSVSEFSEAQAEEMIAARVRDLVRASVRVSPQEVWDSYVAESDRAIVEYMKFSESHYRGNAEATDAEVTAWMAAHADQLTKAYEGQKNRYTGLEKQVKARQLLFKYSGDDEAAKAAAKQKAELARKRAAVGSDFAALAKASSEDEDTKSHGGDLGYTPKGWRPAPFDDAVFALKEGEVSPVVEGPGGFYVFKAEKFREGDVPEAEAKREIAAELAQEAKAADLAKAAADKALADLKAGKSFAAVDRAIAGLPALAEGQDPAADEKDPRENDPGAPHLEDSGNFGRSESPIGGLDAGKFVDTVFAMTTEKPLPAEPLKIGRDYVVFRLKERTLATKEGFTPDTKTRLSESLRKSKADEAVKLYIHQLRDKADKDGAVRRDLTALMPPSQNS